MCVLLSSVSRYSLLYADHFWGGGFLRVGSERRDMSLFWNDFWRTHLYLATEASNKLCLNLYCTSLFNRL